MKRVMVVGSAEQSGGGVTSVIRLIKKMPVWEKYSCFWLGTQIQAGKLIKLKFLLKAYFTALVKIWSFDIIHFHTVPSKVSMGLQLPVMLLALLGRKKIITHLHVGNQLADYTNDRFAIWWMNHSDCIILLAKIFKDQFKELYPNVNTEVRVVYNACDDVQDLPYDQHEKTVVFAGAFRPNKDGSTLIKAFAKVHGKYPQWRLQMLGSGPEEQIYKDLVRETGISGHVDFPGYVTGDILKEYSRKGGIFCLCSHHEGFPMVVLEAWAYGVPVITTCVGGLPDVLEESKNCATFAFGDVETLSRRLDTLMGDEDLRVRMSRYSKEYVQEFFSLAKINESLENLYCEI